MHAALGAVYGSDDERDQIKPYKDRYTLYKEDFNATVPLITSAAVAWAQKVIDSELTQLQDLSDLLKDDRIATDIAVIIGRIAVSLPELFQSRDPSGIEDIAGERLGPRTDLREAQRKFALEIQKANQPVLRTLLLHPGRSAIVSAYLRSVTAGTSTAVGFVNGAVASLREFRESIYSDEHPLNVWRYGMLVSGGVGRRGAADIPGFTRFAIEIGQPYAQGRLERILTQGQYLLIALGVAFAATEFAMGALVVAGTDLVAQATQMAQSYAKDKERELGAAGFDFDAPNKLVERAGYGETLLNGAATLLAGLFLFKTFRSWRELRNAEIKSVASTKPAARAGPAQPPAVRRDDFTRAIAPPQRATRNNAVRPPAPGSLSLDDSSRIGATSKSAARSLPSEPPSGPADEVPEPSADNRSLTFTPSAAQPLTTTLPEIVDGLEEKKVIALRSTSEALARQDVGFFRAIGLDPKRIASVLARDDFYRQNFGTALEYALEREIRADPLLSRYVSYTGVGRTPPNVGRPDWYIEIGQTRIPVDLTTEAERIKRKDLLGKRAYGKSKTKAYTEEGLNLTYQGAP
jgi:hypothetical protein